MNEPSHVYGHATIRRRYLIHLSCAFEASEGTRHYLVRVVPWTSRLTTQCAVRECTFKDEVALAEAINPLLSCGSDVRDVLGHIESEEGFFYLVRLTPEEAETIGNCR